MNKNDLIDIVSQKCDLSKVDANRVCECFINSITDQLRTGGEVRLMGFGTFSVYTRAATQARNPQTGVTMQIPSSKQPKFKAGKALKDAVNS